MKNIYIEPPAQERKYRRLAKMGQELRVPIPECYLEMQVTMPDERIIHHHRQRSHSWNRNAYNVLFSLLSGQPGSNTGTFGPGQLSAKRTSGTIDSSNARKPGSVSHSNYTVGRGYRADSGNDDIGILVGGGDTSESFEDYKLASKIIEGTSEGQLSHVAVDMPVLSYDENTLKLTVIRFFNNNSGGIIEVKEVGLIIMDDYYVSSADFFPYLTARDVLPTAVSIPDTGQLKVTYEIALVYPA